MIKIVFFATPDIALNSLNYLFNKDDIEVCAVVTQPDRPSGRGHKIVCSPIKNYALEHNIKVLQPESIKKSKETIDELKTLNIDFFVTFAFGQILSQEVLDIPKFATINLHASLLPKYRGANPIQRALINGEKETGICTMITELGMDCGNICKKDVIKIDDSMNFENLHDTISEKSPELIYDTLKGIYNGTLTSVPQNSDEATFAPKLSKEECLIDWNKTSQEIHNLVRGIYKSPSAYFVYDGKQIKVLETKICECRENCECGNIICCDKEGVEIKTSNGALKLIRVKPEGKNEISARDWYNGLKGRHI